jgi:hypothetical protein
MIVSDYRDAWTKTATASTRVISHGASEGPGLLAWTCQPGSGAGDTRTPGGATGARMVVQLPTPGSRPPLIADLDTDP